MGILVQGKELWRALFTRTRRRILGLLFGHPDRSFYANEVVRLAGVGTGSVQRELSRLADADLVSVRRVGNQVHYQANRDCPFYPEIRSLVLKTFGALEQVRLALREQPGQVELAFIYGAGADASSINNESVDLLVVSPDLGRQSLEEALEQAGKRIGREIRLVLLRPDRFRRLRDGQDEQWQSVLAQPRVMLAGNQLDLFSNRPSGAPSED